MKEWVPQLTSLFDCIRLLLRRAPLSDACKHLTEEVSMLGLRAAEIAADTFAGTKLELVMSALQRGAASVVVELMRSSSGLRRTLIIDLVSLIMHVYSQRKVRRSFPLQNVVIPINGGVSSGTGYISTSLVVVLSALQACCPPAAVPPSAAPTVADIPVDTTAEGGTAESSGNPEVDLSLGLQEIQRHSSMLIQEIQMVGNSMVAVFRREL